MLSRVSSALTKFIAPIETAVGNDSQSGSQKNQDFQRFSPKKQAPIPSELPKAAPVEKPGPTLSLVPQANVPIEIEKKLPDITDAFLKLLSAFQQGKVGSFRQRGTQLYEMTLKRQKRIGKTLKGAILDSLV